MKLSFTVLWEINNENHVEMIRTNYGRKAANDKHPIEHTKNTQDSFVPTSSNTRNLPPFISRGSVGIYACPAPGISVKYSINIARVYRGGKNVYCSCLLLPPCYSTMILQVSQRSSTFLHPVFRIPWNPFRRADVFFRCNAIRCRRDRNFPRARGSSESRGNY